MKRSGILLLFLFIGSLVLCQKTITVSKDGNGDYSTVQAALDAVPEGNQKPITIFIRKGVYKEVVVIDARKSFIRMKGEDRDRTIITFNNHAGTRLPNGDTLNTWTCASVFIYGNDFSAENIFRRCGITFRFLF